MKFLEVRCSLQVELSFFGFTGITHVRYSWKHHFILLKKLTILILTSNLRTLYKLTEHHLKTSGLLGTNANAQSTQYSILSHPSRKSVKFDQNMSVDASTVQVAVYGGRKLKQEKL
jgi:hypothetical protein